MSDYPEIFPKPDPVLKERTIQESVRFFRQEYYVQPQKPYLWASLFAQWKPFASGVVACAALAVLYVHGAPPGGTDQASVKTVTMASELTLLHEMKQIFGKQLNAVVQDGNNIEPVVDNGASFTDAQPLIMTLKQGDKTLSVMSFSGSTVTLTINHQTVTLSPMVTSDGKVIVEGDHFLWSHGKMNGDPSLSIDAKPLGSSL